MKLVVCCCFSSQQQTALINEKEWEMFKFLCVPLDWILNPTTTFQQKMSLENFSHRKSIKNDEILKCLNWKSNYAIFFTSLEFITSITLCHIILNRISSRFEEFQTIFYWFDWWKSMSKLTQFYLLAIYSNNALHQ